MNKIRVAMCDDAEYLCVNIKNYFTYVDDLEFVGYTTRSSECINLINETKPDILLLDIQLETNASGIDILPEIFNSSPDLKIIMLTSHMDNQYIFDSLVNGASDYIIKNCSNDELVAKIKNVYNNCNRLEHKVFNIFRQQSQSLVTAQKSMMYVINKMMSLSPTELALLEDLYNGQSYNEIAKKRVVENVTVRSMGARILKKLGSPNMRELIKNLKEMQIFDLFSDL